MGSCSFACTEQWVYFVITTVLNNQSELNELIDLITVCKGAMG
jgi:hypothetical protein